MLPYGIIRPQQAKKDSLDCFLLAQKMQWHFEKCCKMVSGLWKVISYKWWPNTLCKKYVYVVSTICLCQLCVCWWPSSISQWNLYKICVTKCTIMLFEVLGKAVIDNFDLMFKLYTAAPIYIIIVVLAYWGRDKTDAISQTTFSNAFFFNENVWIPIKTSLKFVPRGLINNIPALVQIMAWRLPGDKPLSDPMMVSFLTHICVTQPQSVKQCID